MLHHMASRVNIWYKLYDSQYPSCRIRNGYLTNRFGEKWWNEPTAGKKFREIMSKGERINLKEFSKLDPNIFMKEISSWLISYEIIEGEQENNFWSGLPRRLCTLHYLVTWV